MTLPPIPSLDIQRHLRPVTIESDLGPIQVMRPAEAPYQCASPDAPAILLIPGMGMNASGFIRQLPLGALGELHLFENRTEPIADETGLASYARYLEAYITASKLDRLPGGMVLGGASMGGAMSLAVAIRGRIKLRGLLLLGTFGSTATLRWWRRAGMAGIRLSSPWLMRKFGRSFLQHTTFFGRFNRAEAQLLVPPPRFDYRYYVGAMDMLRRMNLIDDAKRLTLPSLILHGASDRVLPLRAGQELASTIPGAHFAPVNGANHMFFLTHSEIVNSAIAEFIGKL